eukprot:2486880-Alexandrium_andersonii.AAC.1
MRRPVLSLFDRLFKTLPAVEDGDVVRELSRSASNELVLLAVLIPMVCLDLAAQRAGRIWCSDAPDDKPAGCVAPCSSYEHCALWARRGRRGC